MSTLAATADTFPEVHRRTTQESPTPRPAQRPTPEQNQSSQQVPPARKSRWKTFLLGVMGVSGVIAGASAYMHHAAKFQSTDNAFVKADIHPVSVRVVGDVVEVLVDDNQPVQKGQPLLRLDARDFEVKLLSARAALTQATAQVPQSEATLAQAQAMLLQAEAQIVSTNAQLEKARLDFERAENLLHGSNRVISQQDFDSAKAAYDAAKGTFSASKAARAAAEANVRSAEAAVAASKAGQERAQAAVDDAALQLSYTTVLAPETGRIAKKTVETGQHVQPGQALMAVVAPDHWIVANFKENQLSDMRVNQSVDIRIDAIHGHHFRGHVESFAPGTGAEFTLLPPDNATGNFTKIVQRIPVKILLNAEDLHGMEGRIAPGLSVTATVRVKE